jgi:hypothetical protein
MKGRRMKRPLLANTKHEPAYQPSLLAAFYPQQQGDVKKQTGESVVMWHRYRNYQRRSQAIGICPNSGIPPAPVSLFDRLGAGLS